MKKLLFALVTIFAVQASAATGDTWNVRSNPVLLLVGLLNVQVDYRLNNNWTVGPTMSSWNIELEVLDEDVKINASSFGVQSRYFFNQAYTDSWYLVGSFGQSSARAEVTDSTGVSYEGSASVSTLAVGGGYHWFWDSFNMNLGLTLSGSSKAEIDLKDSNGNKYDDESTSVPSTGAGIEYTIGWTF